MSNGRRIGSPGRVIHSFYGGEVRQYEDPRRVEVLFETRHWSPSHVTVTGARSQMGVAVGGEQWAAFVKAVTSSVEEAHETRRYAENERGGEARQVVADVARILGTDIDAGPGHRWDADHMQRVVPAAQALKDRAASADVWKELAERNDETSSPIRADLRRVTRERDEWKAECTKSAGDAVYWRQQWEENGEGEDVDELKATIVSQAREIARLKGESA